MIKNNSILGALVGCFSFMLVSCGAGEFDPDYPNALYVKDTALEFDPQGGYQIITVLSRNIAWQVFSQPSWIDVSPAYGADNAMPRVTAEPNLLTVERTDSFFVESVQATNPARYRVIVMQKGSPQP